MENFKLNFPHIKAIIFDLDDTLYDRNLFEFEVYKEISVTLKKIVNLDSDLFVEALKKIKQEKFSNYQNLFRDSLGSIGIYDPNLVLKCIQIYRAYQPKNLELFQGVTKVLEKLRRNYKLGIITNGRKQTQLKKIKALGINNYFDYFVFPDELSNDKKYRKPHIAPYLAMSKLMKIETINMCYIADNPFVDFHGAIKLDITCFRVLTGEYKNIMLDNESKIINFPNIESIFR